MNNWLQHQEDCNIFFLTASYDRTIYLINFIIFIIWHKCTLSKIKRFVTCSMYFYLFLHIFNKDMRKYSFSLNLLKLKKKKKEIFSTHLCCLHRSISTPLSVFEFTILRFAKSTLKCTVAFKHLGRTIWVQLKKLANIFLELFSFFLTFFHEGKAHSENTTWHFHLASEIELPWGSSIYKQHSLYMVLAQTICTDWGFWGLY